MCSESILFISVCIPLLKGGPSILANYSIALLGPGVVSSSRDSTHDLKCADLLRLHFVDASTVQYSGS